VLSLDPHTLAEVVESIRAVGQRAGVPDRAAELVTAMHVRLGQVAERVADRPRPRVAVIEWTDPPFTAGHWIPDLVVAAGGEPVAASPGARSVRSSWASIAAASPDVVIVAPCGFHLAGAADQARIVADILPECEVWAIDADGLVVRPGPRLIDGVEAIASILHPDVVPRVPGRVALVRPLRQGERPGPA
jgi:iron complex transport system substrate-binding protein